MQAILRESVEETGYQVQDLKSLGYIIPTCGYCSEKIYLYHGVAGKEVGQHFDADERIELKLYPFDQIKEMIRNNQIDDAKTIALMYRIEMEGLNG